MTAAEAFLLASSMRSSLDAVRLGAFDEAISMARTCPMVDALDVFCDAVEAMVPMTIDQRSVVIDQLRRDMAFVCSPGSILLRESP